MVSGLAALFIGGINSDVFLIQLLNGLSLGMLYVLMAAGMSVIFGISEILNFAHGVLYMLGAYLAFTIVGETGSFILALFVAPFAVAIIAAGIERSTLSRIYGRGPLYHILLTFGLLLMITDAVEFIWGPGQQFLGVPEALSGVIDLGLVPYPRYRVFIIVISSILAIATWLLFRYTEFGLIIRAGAQDQQTVRLMGVDMKRYFTLVFALGSLLAAAGGVLASPLLNVNPSMGNDILIIAFIVVVVGGLGSFLGSVLAALVIGVLQTLGSVVVPEISGFLIFLVMFAVLIIRPEGILGTYEVRKEAAKLSFDETIRPVSLTDRRVLAVLGVLVLLPVGAELEIYSPYFLGLIATMFVFGMLALSLDIVMGYTGLISFGHAAFFGVGAYAVGLTALHIGNSFLLAVAIAIVVSTVIAWIIGFISMRLAGVYFAMITFAAAQMLYQLSLTLPDITGGSNGLTGMPDMHLLGVVNLSEPSIFYYFALVLLLGAYYVAVRVMDSPFGRVLTAIRESERRATFLGYDTNKYKRRAFAFSGAVGGLSGALFATFQTFVSPNTLFWFVSGDALFAMILGGTGTLFGPIVGGAVLVGLDQILAQEIDQWRFVLGTILVLVVIFAPRGLVSVYRSLTEWVSNRRPPTAVPDPSLGQRDTDDSGSAAGDKP
jgi:branched-chain amino acid transport system permease protein